MKANEKQILSVFMRGTDFQCDLDSWDQIMKIVWEVEAILKREPELIGYFAKTSYVIYRMEGLCVANYKKGVVDELTGFVTDYLLKDC